MDPITPMKPLRGRAATKAHHRKPSHDVAVRAFASTAGKGKLLLEYAAEMIKAGRIVQEDDLQRLVDSCEFGRWLERRHNDRKVEKRVIVAEVANPNRPLSVDKPAANNAGAEFRAAIKQAKELREQDALRFDAEEAIRYCLINKCPEKFEEVKARITNERHTRESLAAWRKRK